MWSSANGSGIRSQRMPGATSHRLARRGRRGERVVEHGGMRRVHADKDAGHNPVWYRARRRRPFRRSHAFSLRHVRCPTPCPPAKPRRPREPTYTISELAREFALTTRAIRFYEDEGLIAPARHGRARVYGERERVRLKLILRGKRLGLGAGRDRASCSTSTRSRATSARSSRKFLDLLADRRARLLQQKEDIDAVLAEIDGVERECRRRLKEDGAAAKAARRAQPRGEARPRRAATGRQAD